MRSFVFLLALLLCGSAQAWGQSALDDALLGFDDEASEVSDTETSGETAGKSLFDIYGSMSLSNSYNVAHKEPRANETDYRGLSRSRANVNLKLKANLSEKWKAHVGYRAFYDMAYAINGRDRYTSDVLQTYENETELREAYLHGELSRNLDIKFGRQIVVWGKSDNVRVTDVLNPLDNREPGMVDIEDLRLPVYMSRLDYYLGDLSFTAIAIHEIRFNKTPSFGSDFYPFAVRAPVEDVPGDKIENTEYAFALNGLFTGWDISFYLADIYDDQPHVEQVASLSSLSPAFKRSHSRLTMAGLAANMAYGSWLLKTEMAYFYGFEFFGTPDDKKSRYDILIGAEYSGFTDSVVSVELVNRHLNDFNDRIKTAGGTEDEFQVAIRASGNYFYDTLHPLALVSFFGTRGEDGGFQRVSVGYDLTDAWLLTVGAVFYQSGNLQFFKNVGDNDRLFLDFKYSF
ncbi:hypothetical protein MNBD_NITROSPINAE01-1967 [hydrothermal vent metagenome]|uniref:DUF1302 domain-containing protein n=1 Tax=hydrothermal vent metagenome TaxID=652676 RepID=A0A3B1C7Z6_9ZZZZ